MGKAHTNQNGAQSQWGQAQNESFQPARAANTGVLGTPTHNELANADDRQSGGKQPPTHADYPGNRLAFPSPIDDADDTMTAEEDQCLPQYTTREAFEMEGHLSKPQYVTREAFEFEENLPEPQYSTREPSTTGEYMPYSSIASTLETKGKLSEPQYGTREALLTTREIPYDPYATTFTARGNLPEQQHSTREAQIIREGTTYAPFATSSNNRENLAEPQPLTREDVTQTLQFIERRIQEIYDAMIAVCRQMMSQPIYSPPMTEATPQQTSRDPQRGFPFTAETLPSTGLTACAQPVHCCQPHEQNSQQDQRPIISNTHADLLRIKVNKDFKQTLAAPATNFDGKSSLKYMPWKEALQREVEGLDLDAYQWLDLLRVRTSGKARTALQPTIIIQQDSSNDVLARSIGGLRFRFNSSFSSGFTTNMLRPANFLIHS